MRILADIVHPAHVNFLKKALRILNEDNEIIVTYLDRGRLPSIVKSDLAEFRCYKVGRHGDSFLSIIFQANILRFLSLLRLARRERADLGLSVGSFTLGAALKVLGRDNFQFSDDLERKLSLLLRVITSTRLFFPPIVGKSKHFGIYNALKEWAYLSPTYFSPDICALREYELAPKEYIFVREVSTGSLNYKGQMRNLIAKIAPGLPKDVKTVLSLEDKKSRNQYPGNWTILEEPVNSIHSLMYYSKVILSSGDSMAREGGVLGVPTIYCGARSMKTNDILVSKKILLHLHPEEVAAGVAAILSGKSSFPDQIHFRQDLEREWSDVTKFIVTIANKHRVN